MRIAISMLVIAVALLGISSTVLAEECVFEETTNNFYDNLNNWSCVAVPGSSDTVVLDDSDDVCVVRAAGSNQACISFSLVPGAVLTIEAARTLTITGNCVVDGTVNLLGTLSLGANVTISGDGDLIMQVDSGVFTGTIGGGNTRTLTLNDDAGGDPLDLRGTGDVDVNLVNNAIVQAGASCDGCSFDSDLFLNFTVSGSGTYQATLGQTLQVVGEASGLATWKTLTDSSNNRIIMMSESCVSGNVEIPNGTFRVEADFCTTGNLILGDGTDLQDADVEVAKDMTATFGLGVAATCTCS